MAGLQNYDVFLSFRGKDTRYVFTRNLYDSLCRRGIRSFFDDQGVEKGQVIRPSLFKAIDASTIAIVVFSKDYASSHHCLDELVHITKRFKEGRIVLLPVFYYVDPSQVRRQKGTYGEAFARHEDEQSEEKVKEWREALSAAGDLSGWKVGNEVYESDRIAEITEDVYNKIKSVPALSSHDHERSSGAATSSSSSSSHVPLDISSMPRISLAPSQIEFCREALRCFGDKLNNQHVISQEFSGLQRLPKEREFNFRPEWLRDRCSSTEYLGPRNFQQPQRRQEQDGARATVSGVGVGRSHSDMFIASTRSHRQPQPPNMHDTAVVVGRGHNLRLTGIGQAQSQPPQGQYAVRHTTAATSQWRQPRPTHTQAQPQHAPDYPPRVLQSSIDGRPTSQAYVDASFITIPNPERVSRFIVAQSPLPQTYAANFWETIVQDRCAAIVMLTSSVDDFRFVDYFLADNGPSVFGNISVITKSRQHIGTSLVLRDLEVNRREQENASSSLSVLHIQYGEWPDDGVPSDTVAVRYILRRLCNLPPNLGPIAVDCRGGIGRTGTYCAIHNTIQRILVLDSSALDLASTIRSQRIGIVQTQERYFFCYEAIVDELEALVSQQHR